jgi:hypothetical protein
LASNPITSAAPPALRSVAHTTGSSPANACTEAISSSSADSSFATRLDNNTRPTASMTAQ